MTDIAWSNERRKLADLTPQEDNPRQIREAQAKRLDESWREYGQVETMAIGPNGAIYNGHQRYYILLAQHGPDYEVDCRVASRDLSHREWQRLTVLLHEGAVGEWNFDDLANWDVEIDILGEWGLDLGKLGLEPFGETSTDRDGQGVSSAWGQVNSATVGKVVIDDIETRLSADVIELLKDLLISEFEKNDRPIHETLEGVIVAGIRAFEDSDS